MAPHSSTLVWKIPWTKEPGRLQSMGSLESDTTEWLHFHFSLSCFGEGNGNPLQCSCLENPRDGGAWWAAVYGVTPSRTWLKWLSSSRAYIILWASLIDQSVNHLPVVQKTRVQSLGLGRSPGEGNGNPLQYSRLENPTDRGAWQAMESQESDMT